MPSYSTSTPKKSVRTAEAAPRAASASGPGNEAMKERLAGAQRQGVAKQGDFRSVKRDAADIAESGVLDEFRQLAGVEVPASELDRTLDDDAVLVQQGLARMSPDEIAALKEAAYEHPECKEDLQPALDKKHYGSERHRKYGETVEFLTGGVISAEEAMAMNPTGGIPGPGAKEIPFSTLEPIARHAMRHDATGFLMTRLGVGPGYGSKTTIFGRANTDPLAGQILGVVREMFAPTTDLPTGDAAARSGRFNEGSSPAKPTGA